MRTKQTGTRLALAAALAVIGVTGAGCNDWGRPGHDSDRHHSRDHDGHRGDHGDHGDDHRGPG